MHFSVYLLETNDILLLLVHGQGLICEMDWIMMICNLAYVSRVDIGMYVSVVILLQVKEDISGKFRGCDCISKMKLLHDELLFSVRDDCHLIVIVVIQELRNFVFVVELSISVMGHER